jgi:hypothetical protein
MSRVLRAIAKTCSVSIVAVALPATAASDFRFERDILAFKNTTVFEYHGGYAYVRKAGRRLSSAQQQGKEKPYNRRCFVMTRTILQFHKFARFDPKSMQLDDKGLAARIRMVTRHHPWDPALPESQRIVFPGYTDLYEMSKARGPLLQENIGLGWPTFVRFGNMRMFFLRGEKYQEKTHEILNAVLDRGDLFIGYLSSYPWFTINHAVLVYARKPVRSRNGIERYLVYDPNHLDAPRELKWSPTMRIFNYQKDEEFVGGYTRVYQIYGKWLQ